MSGLSEVTKLVVTQLLVSNNEVAVCLAWETRLWSDKPHRCPCSQMNSARPSVIVGDVSMSKKLEYKQEHSLPSTIVGILVLTRGEK